MKIKMVTGYSIRSLLYIAHKGGIIPKSEICSVMRIPGSYFDKMVKQLKAGGIITNHMGSQGGFELTMPADQISLLMLYTMFEGTFDSSDCCMCDSKCTLTAEDLCPLRNVTGEISEAVKEKLASTTIGSLLKDDNMDYYFAKIESEKPM